MRVLSIAGPSNNSGKTLLACRIVEAATGRWQAVKVSTIYGDGNCPVSLEAAECACRQMHGDAFKVVDDPAVLTEADTDTGELHEAGAEPLFWGLARPGAHADLWEHIRPLLHADKPLITEGGQVARLLDPSALVAVVNPATEERWKADADELMARADLVVINPFDESGFLGDHPRAAELTEQLERSVVFDVSRPAEAWPDPLRELVDRVLA